MRLGTVRATHRVRATPVWRVFSEIGFADSDTWVKNSRAVRILSSVGRIVCWIRSTSWPVHAVRRPMNTFFQEIG